MPKKNGKNPSLILPDLPDQDEFSEDGPPPIPGDTSFHELCTLSQLMWENWYEHIKKNPATKSYEMLRVMADQANTLIGDFSQMAALLCAGAEGEGRIDLSHIDPEIMKQLTEYDPVKSLKEAAEYIEKNGWDEDEIA